jgi:superfamily II RNA helicase
VLVDAGFLADDTPTELGLLASSLFGENALLIADAIAAGHLEALDPAELAAALVTLVAEDRGRDLPQPSRRHFPTPRVEVAYRRLRGSLQRLAEVERTHGLQTLRPLSLDYVNAAHQWASGTPLLDIETPAANDIGDVVKAMKNLYSMLRQMEQALRGHALLGRVRRAREAMERDLIRRV